MKKKILVIEDEENLAKLIQAFLEKNGYDVAYISVGIESLADVREHIPDLILTDLLLPGLHGFDICRNIRNDSQLRDIPLMIMTAVYKNAIHKLEAKKLGVKEFVDKPIDFDELLKKIQQFIGPGESSQVESFPQVPSLVIAAPPVTETPPSTPPPTTLPTDWDDITKPEVVKTQPKYATDDSAADNLTENTREYTNEEKDAGIRAHFRRLQENYAAKLPDKVSEMESLWENVLQNHDRTKQLTKLRRNVHSLTGSGTTFGLDEISEIARDLELTLDMIIAEGEETIQDRKEHINQLLDNMRHHPVVSTQVEISRLARKM